MKYAVIKTGGKQYKVEEGQIIEVEKLGTFNAPLAPDSQVVFDEVLLVVEGDQVELGAPTLPDKKVYAQVIAEIKGDKIEVFKYKSKSRYRKHTGHRQKYTQLKITGIGQPAKPAKVAKPAKPAKKAPAKKISPKKPVAKKAVK